MFGFLVVRGLIPILGGIGVFLARAAHDFLKDFGILVPEIPKFCSAVVVSLSELGPASLSIGIYMGD